MGKAKSEDHCSDQNGANTLPVGVAHTYIAYIREYPSPPGLESKAVMIIIITKARLVFLEFPCHNNNSVFPVFLSYVQFSLESLNR